ncbi:transposase [Legionella busanensis]|uniref:Transposase n=2 Tax=Legionella busanensis TaxID=190655 RepID=A0A378KEF0_9GAMM|nr:Tn3 family transposase [Legionella busanensis]STX81622.1 transposase [Legionella busanensis]
MKQQANLSEDEIIRDWSLSAADSIFIKKFKKQYQLWGFLQICALRLFGQLMDNPNTLDTRIIGHACKLLNLDIVGTVDLPRRDATRTDYKKSIFSHLNFKPFNDSKAIFYDWLKQKMQTGMLIPENLVSEAEAFLIANKVVLPTLYYLRREINSFCSQHQEKIFTQIYQQLSEALIHAIDETLEIIPNEDITWFQKFKEYPGSSSISVLQDYFQRYQKLEKIDLSIVDMSIIEQELVKHLYQLAKHYDAYKIRRFKPPKRYALMVLFLAESKKVLMDYLIQLHDQYISNVCRECRNTHHKNLKLYKHKNERAIDKIERFIDFILVQEDDYNLLVSDLYSRSTQKSDLQRARNDMHEYQVLSRFGYAKLLQNRYSSMRRYFADFIQLPFLFEKGSPSLQQSIELVRKLDKQEMTKIPSDMDTRFMDGQLTIAMRDKNGEIKRSLWEMGLAVAIKDGFRSGDLYVEHSNKYASFWNLIYQDYEWQQEKVNSYQALEIIQDVKIAVGKIVENFHRSAMAAANRFKSDDFANIKNGNLFLKRKDKIDIPDDVERLQALINSYMPKIKIEQLLIEVDHLTGFTKHFTPIHGQKGRPENFYKTLIASILAQATNIGLATMENCISDITAKMMRHVTDTCIREETIKAANAELVNQHTQLDLSQNYGDGKMSSSDGQRFIITASSLLSSYYPRYAGYYDKMIGIYTHTSNQLSVLNTQAISCAPRESLYVIDGLLGNNTILAIKEHTTDTEGFTEHVFALCYLLGIRFMPRIKDLKSQQLYRIDKEIAYGELDALLTKTASIEPVIEQFDQMVRVAASLKKKLSPAHEIIRRFSKGSPYDKLSKAFTQLGRILKTEYILQYISDSDLRDKVQRQLNKGEHRHQLARCIFFANQGKFQVGDYEEIMNKASCLSLVSNAVLYWNTVKMTNIIAQLKTNGEVINDNTLTHISLLLHKHLITMGTYFTNTTIVQPEIEDVGEFTVSEQI